MAKVRLYEDCNVSVLGHDLNDTSVSECDLGISAVWLFRLCRATAGSTDVPVSISENAATDCQGITDRGVTCNLRCL